MNYLRYPAIRWTLAFGFTFFVGSLLWIAAHFYGLDSFLFPPAPHEQPTRAEDERRTVFTNLPYIDKWNQRIWYFQSLDTAHGEATGVEILDRDAQGRDRWKYFAKEATWNGEFWKLKGVAQITFGPDGSVLGEKHLLEIDLPDLATPPSSMVPHH